MFSKIKNGNGIASFYYLCGIPVAIICIVYVSVLYIGVNQGKWIYLAMCLCMFIAYVAYQRVYTMGNTYMRRFAHAINLLICMLNVVCLFVCYINGLV